MYVRDICFNALLAYAPWRGCLGISDVNKSNICSGNSFMNLVLICSFIHALIRTTYLIG